MIFLKTKKYGVGYEGEYDPRHPGYFIANFEINGEQKQIRNLKASDLEMLVEQIDDCMKVHDFDKKSINYFIVHNDNLFEIDEATLTDNSFLKLKYLNF